MLILPAEQPLDWKRPPVITLLLILLNTLIYLGYQSGDDVRTEAAVRSYLDGGLLNRERALFQERMSAEHELDEDEQKGLAALPRNYLAAMILRDLEFEHRLHLNLDYLADDAWQKARGEAEALRDKISSVRFGFIPAKFTLQGLFGAMFLHGSFDHLLGNMLFLFIVGFALEAALGRWMYLGLYIASGLASHLLWWVCDPVWVSGIGASGAVSGLMGMYAGMFGLRKIKFFYWLGPLIGYLKAPAILVLIAWIGKELYGIFLSDDHVNYYAHLGGLVFGFLAVWLTLHAGALKVDKAYLDKEDPDAPFKRELAALEQTIGNFALEQAAARGLDMLQRYPARITLLERLYPLARTRNDNALLSAILKQLFALPADSGKLPLLQKLAKDMGDPTQSLPNNQGLQLHLLQQLLKARDDRHALFPWRKLAARPQAPEQMPALSLQLGKLLGQRDDRQSLAEVGRFLREAFPEAEPTRQYSLLQQHLNR